MQQLVNCRKLGWIAFISVNMNCTPDHLLKWIWVLFAVATHLSSKPLFTLKKQTNLHLRSSELGSLPKVVKRREMGYTFIHFIFCHVHWKSSTQLVMFLEIIIKQ